MASRLQKDDRVCYLCGNFITSNRDKHHIFNGTAYRQKSEDDELYVYLHHCCHMWLHNHPKSMWTFKQRGQRVYETEIGCRNDFIKRYGKNYLED